MHIHDFHSKFASMNEEDHLFRALRKLSLVEDLKSMFEGDGILNIDWIPWSSLASNVACPLPERG